MSIIRLIILFSFFFFFFSCSQRSEIFMVAASMNNLMTEIQSENPQFNDIPISYGGSISIVRRIENNNFPVELFSYQKFLLFMCFKFSSYLS